MKIAEASSKTIIPFSLLSPLPSVNTSVQRWMTRTYWTLYADELHNILKQTWRSNGVFKGWKISSFSWHECTEWRVRDQQIMWLSKWPSETTCNQFCKPCNGGISPTTNIVCNLIEMHGQWVIYEQATWGFHIRGSAPIHWALYVIPTATDDTKAYKMYQPSRNAKNNICQILWSHISSFSTPISNKYFWIK